MTSLYSYTLPTRLETYPIRKGLLLEHHGGWGEIAPLPGFSEETLQEATEEILSLLPNKAFLNKPIRCASVRFGVASALAPLPTTPVQIPLCLLNRTHPEFPISKFKIGHLNAQEAIQYVKRLMQTATCRFRLDCNRKWTLKEALAFAQCFKPDDFEYIEEPVATQEELIAFCEQTQFPVAVDGLWNQMEEIPTLKAIVVKPTLTGNLPLFPINIPTVFSSAYESSLGLLHIAHRFHKGMIPCGIDTSQYLIEDLLSPPLQIEKGYLHWKPSPHLEPIDRSRLCLIATVP